MSFGKTASDGGKGMSFGSPKSAGKGDKKEDVTLKVFPNQIVQLVIPYQTRRAKEIRQVATSEIYHNEKQVWTFRGDELPHGWTNVDRNSTSENPCLTAPPVYAVTKTVQVMKNCPAVANVYVRHGETNSMLSEHQLRTFRFVSLHNQ